jgi:autotransporter-associated beta strand protein
MPGPLSQKPAALTSTAGRRPRERSIASSDSRRRTKLQRTPRSPSATITNNNNLNFQFGSAGSATITNNSLLLFTNSGTGGTARLLNAAAGTIDLSGSNGITAGSIEGAGRISLGSNNMAVGGNNLSTTFSGVLKDGGIFFGGTGGSLTKTGAGALTLAGASTYTGVTTVNSGTLSVNGSIANSALTVNAGGTLGGNGTVGNTTINGGTLAPGNSSDDRSVHRGSRCAGIRCDGLRRRDANREALSERCAGRDLSQGSTNGTCVPGALERVGSGLRRLA